MTTLPPAFLTQRLTLAVVGCAVGFGATFVFGSGDPRLAMRTTAASAVTAHPRAGATRGTTLNPFPPPAVRRGVGRTGAAIVAFFVPGSQLDATTLAEARAGAARARAPFFAVDVTRAATASLLRHYGVRSTPSVIVLGARDRVAFRTTTFVDAATVVQAVDDARG